MFSEEFSLGLAYRKLEDFGEMDKTLANHELLSFESQLELSTIFQEGYKIRRHQAKANVSDVFAAARQLNIKTHHVPIILAKADVAQRVLISANMRLVLFVARRFINRGLTYSDLVQEGVLGLVRAIEKFDPHQRVHFSTYAVFWIRQAISRAIAEKSRVVRIPEPVHYMSLRISRTEYQLAKKLGRPPKKEEVARDMAISVHKLDALIRSTPLVLSTESEVVGMNGRKENMRSIRFGELLSSQLDVSDPKHDRTPLRYELENIFTDLTKQEAAVIEMRYGLWDGEPRTLKECVRHFNTTSYRTQQILKQALMKMKDPTKTERVANLLRSRGLLRVYHLGND